MKSWIKYKRLNIPKLPNGDPVTYIMRTPSYGLNIRFENIEIFLDKILFDVKEIVKSIENENYTQHEI